MESMNRQPEEKPGVLPLSEDDGPFELEGQEEEGKVLHSIAEQVEDAKGFRKNRQEDDPRSAGEQIKIEKRLTPDQVELQVNEILSASALFQGLPSKNQDRVRATIENRKERTIRPLLSGELAVDKIIDDVLDTFEELYNNLRTKVSSAGREELLEGTMNAMRERMDLFDKTYNLIAQNNPELSPVEVYHETNEKIEEILNLRTQQAAA